VCSRTDEMIENVVFSILNCRLNFLIWDHDLDFFRKKSLQSLSIAKLLSFIKK
jgi:hypothetical protein